MIRFRYSEQEWEKIQSILKKVKCDNPDTVRGQLERIAVEYLINSSDNALLLPAAPRRKQWEKVQKAADQLLASIGAITDKSVPLWGLPSEEQRSLDLSFFAEAEMTIESLAAKAKRYAAIYDNWASMFTGHRDPDRTALFDEVFRIWIEAGGQLTFTRSVLGAVEGNLPDFFSAALRPVLGDRMLEREGLVELLRIRKAGPRRKSRSKPKARKTGARRALGSKSKLKINPQLDRR